ncbi:hypothetical protein SBOR_7478 [Sclerotinia borealis F-4128]|uniref:Uncharacterized protein n=1 Tax=Sclerotinia borealis (strain F-4128) TaxID=1432307 RepID=W9C8E5_SCLBF|nr:hypothetical protein SBOR_7478 [Sclerotinia borealis F-4128]
MEDTVESQEDAVGTAMGSQHYLNDQMRTIFRKMKDDPSVFEFTRFARREGFEVKLQDIKLSFELVTVENKEALEFPPEFYNLETKTFETIADEKIEVKRSSMICLHMASETILTNDDKQEIWDSEQTNLRKFPIANHITPPLSLILKSSPNSPLPVLGPACEIQLLSDPNSSNFCGSQRRLRMKYSRKICQLRCTICIKDFGGLR